MSFLKYRVMKRLFLFAVCAWAGLSLWASGVKGQGTACETRSEKVPAKVYMIKEISSESLMKVYEALGRKATGKVAVKLSTGEPGNNNYLDPALIKGLVQKVDGTIVECNTAYGGGRSDTEKHLPALILCPTSLLENWAREAEKFVPTLKTLVISGPDRGKLWENALFHDICICSYSIIKRDVEHVRGLRFKYLILDEAQHIKNPSTGNSQTCKSIEALHKLVLTGTPLENSPEDLWSIFDFLHQGMFGSLNSFRKKYIGQTASPEAIQDLSSRIAPFILRRRKSDVYKEIPPKVEQTLYCEMDESQQRVYNAFLAEGRRKCEILKSGSHGLSKFEILSSLLRLRQVCCHPDLIPGTLRPDAGQPVRSAKMELLKELLLETIDSGHKVLLFSQFTSLLSIVRSWLDSESIRYEYLDGATTDRMAHVDNFNNSPDIPLFLLSLKAGGLGLNLTSADTVIIYDPWWNPAAEAQAADRTHRIGQTKSVNCIKLLVKNSIEEKVLELQRMKAGLFNNLVEAPSEAMRGMSMEDFEFLLKD